VLADTLSLHISSRVSGVPRVACSVQVVAKAPLALVIALGAQDAVITKTFVILKEAAWRRGDAAACLGPLALILTEC
jgi:hypothetical protein